MTGLPQAFTDRMKKMLGEEYDSFLKSYETDKTVGIRVNTLKIDKDDFIKTFPKQLKPVEWCDTGFRAERDEKFGRLALHDAGAFYMQEPSAMSVVSSMASVSDLRGLKVLDLCAAPGGKSTQAAALMQNEGLIVSNEINATRAQILSSNMERIGVRNSIVLNETPEKIASSFEEYFDVVFVDAPCSGEGMFRKDENAVSEWSTENVKMCAERQKTVLNEAKKTVAEGGYLVYSTCTFSVEENELQIADFLENNSDFEIASSKNFEYFENTFDCNAFLKSESINEIPAEICEKSVRLWPHKIDGEGHFVCILKRKGQRSERTSETDSLKRDKQSKKNTGKNNSKNNFKLTKKLVDEFLNENLISFGEKDNLTIFGDSVYLKPEAFDKSVEGLKVLRLGLWLGDIKKDRFEPSHSLAMALRSTEAKRVVNIYDEEALKYRHGEELRIDCENGWTLVCSDGVSLGWGKAVNGVIKNHYPKGLRIKF